MNQLQMIKSTFFLFILRKKCYPVDVCESFVGERAVIRHYEIWRIWRQTRNRVELLRNCFSNWTRGLWNYSRLVPRICERTNAWNIERFGEFWLSTSFPKSNFKYRDSARTNFFRFVSRGCFKTASWSKYLDWSCFEFKLENWFMILVDFNLKWQYFLFAIIIFGVA